MDFTKMEVVVETRTSGYPAEYPIAISTAITIDCEGKGAHKLWPGLNYCLTCGKTLEAPTL